MSTRKIKSALIKKGIPFINIEWVRGNSECESEWFIEFTEGTKQDLFEASKKEGKGELTTDHFNYPGGNAETVMEFIDELPSLKGAKS
ncbi:hypothetical protein F938_00833 [Acinetobacter bereziniae LMG 1003 = CIP 70.12]|uniref:Uncharacterized protein n=1 Tax=Acinetobacter bereziniae LMG 1003 = CIP 70.12 TaxID=981324 RepID=N9F5S1_ACIBZ|nr:hypothetical protein [Acinetobacter bereziniae]ENW00189.1 hypothetical protein F938_00833 [Acinetobacter bereziniae LMG 1003 = CIP 70.12]